MKTYIAPLFGAALLLLPAQARAQAPVAPVTGFQFSQAPCATTTALSAGGWCVDVVTIEVSGGPPIVPPTTAPGTPIVSGPTASTPVGTQVVFTGSGVAGNVVAVYVDNNLTSGLVLVNGSGFWSMPANASFAKGSHVAAARQWNGIGASGLSAPMAFSIGP